MTINLALNGPVFSSDVIDPFIIGDADSDARFKELGLVLRTDDASISVDKNATNLYATSRVWAFDKRGKLVDSSFEFRNSYHGLLSGTADVSSFPDRSSRNPSPMPHYIVIFSEAQLQALLTHYDAELVNRNKDEAATGDRDKHFHGTENNFNHKIKFPNDDLPTSLRVIASATDPVDGTTRPRLYVSENEELGEMNRRIRIIKNIEGGEPITSASLAAILICAQDVITSATRFTRAQNDLLGSLLKGIVKQHNDSINKIVSRVNESLVGSGSLPIRTDDLAIDFGATTNAPYSFPQREGGKHLANLYDGEVELRRLVSSFNLDALHSILTDVGDDTPTAKEIRQAWISLTDSYIAREAEAETMTTEPGEGPNPVIITTPETTTSPEPDGDATPE